MSNSPETFDPVQILSKELDIPANKVAATIQLLNEGNTVPFIARYRKEVTGTLDEVQIHNIEERLAYHKELHERRQTIIDSITEQGKMVPELLQALHDCTTKAALEDLYLPYKPKRRTRATIAREKGLAPLAEKIMFQNVGEQPLALATSFINSEKGVESAEDALQGAKDIVAEAVSENATVRQKVRDHFASHALLRSEAVPETTKEPTKFEQYYDFQELLCKMPSHRFLAVRRGESEGFLKTSLIVDKDTIIPQIAAVMEAKNKSPWYDILMDAIEDSYGRLLAPSIETDLRTDYKLQADESAVEVFAQNLRQLLLAAPMGSKSVIGIDPGIRTGCKVAALDDNGNFQENITIYPYNKDEKIAQNDLAGLIAKYHPYAIAIGNGTAGRETESFVRKLLKEKGWSQDIIVVMVSESGASVYSASEIARQEFPDLDLTVRGAISIARRLQDPLAELVKIDPKAIGVGQYQHDVFQPLLKKKLDQVVESCVNHVGVELNTASGALLSYVAGIGPVAAGRITGYRQQHGSFHSRQELLKVPGIGPKTFQQAAGFLRVRGAANPLDSSAVHPERYALVERIARDLGISLQDLIGSPDQVKRIKINNYINDEVGLATLNDIMAELLKPGLDPRQDFAPPKFREDVSTIEDLQPGMVLEGQVTNVTNFGAFVDIGVHQDGLIHLSQLADRYVSDPAEVVSVGDRLQVTVLDVDIARKRISLSARQDAKDNLALGVHGKENGPTKSKNRNSLSGPRPANSSGPAPKFNQFAALKNLKLK